tara:strand:- start:251 stop:1024 length:774 start_codon:yes stop_codon:yes gene_type:complete
MDKVDALLKLEDHPSIIVSGPARCGKSTCVLQCLRDKGIKVDVQAENVYFQTKKNDRLVDCWVNMRRSQYYNEVNMNDVFCNDSMLLSEILSMVINTIKFDTKATYIIFKHFDKASYTAQAMLRRLMEQYSLIKCIFMTRHINGVIDSIKSRTINIRMAFNTIEKDQMSEFNTRWEVDVENIINNPVSSNIYVALMNLLEPTEIFTEIFNILRRKTPKQAYKILEIVAECEARCAQGTKAVYHIEHCLNLLKFHNII